MAVKKKRNNNLRKNNKENYFSFSSDKTKKILGILLIFFSTFLLFSIISYDRRDEANLTGLFSTSEQGAEIYNWAGIFGAYISDFFIKSTIGYFWYFSL
jgi:S-DNA-T family DNA segregation ATPase FtsK/SpoIIIE